jgi:hypothetical protein
VNGQLDAPAALPARELATGTHCIGGWVGPALDDIEEGKCLTLLGLEIWPLGRPARSQSFYRLRYRGKLLVLKYGINLQLRK